MIKRLCGGIAFFIIIFVYQSFSQPQSSMTLPAPQRSGGKPLMDALNERKTSRDFSSRELPAQELSNLLWAAFGINREDSGKRTAPSAMNTQEIEIYVALQTGLYLYDAAANKLNLALAQDIRKETGKQGFVADAPVNLIFVASTKRMKKISDDQKDFYAAVNTGYISQNVYLYCASANLATVVRGWVDREHLHKVMQLKPEQKIILAQTVGYPKEKR